MVFRHAEINKMLKRAFAGINNIPAQLEPSVLDGNYGKIPDGTTIIPWTLVWDFARVGYFCC